MNPEARHLLERALRLARQVPMVHEYSYRMSSSCDAASSTLPEEMRECQVAMSEASALERDIGALLLSAEAQRERIEGAA